MSDSSYSLRFSVPNFAEPGAFIITDSLHMIHQFQYCLRFEKYEMRSGTWATLFAKGVAVFQQSVMLREIAGHRPLGF
jgi:hypothetical protein